jgi:hypothetical protein
MPFTFAGTIPPLQTSSVDIAVGVIDRMRGKANCLDMVFTRDI